ncbi:unnamed protein product, partial [Didymodactylos carnosus]
MSTHLDTDADGNNGGAIIDTQLQRYCSICHLSIHLTNYTSLLYLIDCLSNIQYLDVELLFNDDTTTRSDIYDYSQLSIKVPYLTYLKLFINGFRVNLTEIELFVKNIFSLKRLVLKVYNHLTSINSNRLKYRLGLQTTLTHLNDIYLILDAKG